MAEAKRKSKRSEKKTVKFERIYQRDDPYGCPTVPIGMVDQTERSSRVGGVLADGKERKKKSKDNAYSRNEKDEESRQSPRDRQWQLA